MSATATNPNHFANPPYFAGEDDDGDEILDSWDIDTGKPGIGLFANAVQVWSLFQQKTVTVFDAARAFNVPAAMIREAVEWHPWMLLEGKDGDIIGHDGE